MFIWFVMIVILTVAGYVTPFWRNMYIKMKYYLYSMKYLIQTDDLPKKFTGTNAFPMDSKGSNSYVNGKRVIRIVFIRHGQSVWNSIFNAFGMGWPMRVLRAITYETINFFMNPFESILIDSPLSAKGKKEAMELSSFLATAKDKLSLDPATSVIVSSNLRRAMETALVGLESRMRSTHERIAVCSSLQEGSRNVDAQSLSTEKGKLAPMCLGYIVDPAKLHTVFDPSLNEGNKKMGINVYQRMDKFVQQMIGAARGESLTPAISESIRTNDDLKEIIVVGHSGYFRNFFRRFLPVESSHVSKKSKMQNCAAVSFNLVRDATSGQVTIEESSIMVLYRGFK